MLLLLKDNKMNFTAKVCKLIFRSNLIQLRLYHKNEVRVRFAPSPTGYLHLGGLRTALYNFLFAKAHSGKFILRIEDTDQKRVVAGAMEQLQTDLAWAGIQIDEDPNTESEFGPYIQSKRLHIYREQVGKLLTNESAYCCFCTDKRLDLLRREAIKAREVPKYDNRCRHLSKVEINKKLESGAPHCIRFKLASGSETFDDIIYGSVSYDITVNEGDPVIMKTDGFPTYHFANVVDDHFMQVSHVLRGVEWQISTTKHILMYRAFNWEPPIFGHLPLLMNPDGSKLSKRQGDIQISHYKSRGILPQALINFIVHSGGGFEKDQERGLKPKSYTMDELIKQFDVTKINSHSGKLMPERLDEFNRLEIERQIENVDDFTQLVLNVQKLVKERFPDRSSDNLLNLDENYIKSILKWTVKRIFRLEDLVSNQLLFLWIAPLNNTNYNTEELQALERLKTDLPTEQLTKDYLNKFLRNFCQENNMPFANFMKLLRSVLSGLKEGPSVAEMIEILGKDNTVVRLEAYLNKNKMP